MNRETLLREFERLPYGERMRQIIEVGHRSISDASAAKALAEMAGGSVYERQLALQACHGTDYAAILSPQRCAPALL